MSDRRENRDVSPISSHRLSTSTAEQSGADVGNSQNGSVTQRHPQPSGVSAPTSSTDNLVSQPAANNPSVTIQAVDPTQGSNGQHKTVTIQQDSSTQSAHVQSNGNGPPTEPSVEKPGLQRSDYTVLSIIHCWCLEVLALLLAAITVVIIVVLLHYYHDRSVRSWNHNWAINSVFAFLTAIMDASVAFAVTSALGQLRWLWYTDTKNTHLQLKWMDRLTNAKAAPGAVRFAIGNIKTAIRHWAILGAALTVALLGVGVFVQNVITVRGKELSVDNVARVPVTDRYKSQWEYGSTGRSPGDQMPDVYMASAIIAGFTFPANTQQKDFVTGLVHCSTGNCTFGLYSSLSLCHRCANVSEQILCPNIINDNSSCPSGSLTRLPDDSLSLDPLTGVVNITSDDQYSFLSNMTDIGPLVARYVAMGYWNTPAHAVECALYWCVETHNATVEANLFQETAVQSWTNTSAAAKTFYGQDQPIYLYPPSCHRDGKETQDCKFEVDALSQRALQNYLINGSESTNSSGFLKGHVTIPPGSHGLNWSISSLAANTIIAPCFGIERCSVYQHSFYLLPLAFRYMARYMSNAIREATGGYSYGTTSRFDSYFHVRWGWLAYPVAVVLVAFIFLFVTIYKARGTEPWKSSVMALLFHGLTDEDREAYLRLNDPLEMRKAEDWIVTLQDIKGTRSFRVKSRGLPGFGSSTHDGGDMKDGMVNVGMAILRAAEDQPM